MHTQTNTHFAAFRCITLIEHFPFPLLLLLLLSPILHLSTKYIAGEWRRGKQELPVLYRYLYLKSNPPTGLTNPLPVLPVQYEYHRYETDKQTDKQRDRKTERQILYNTSSQYRVTYCTVITVIPMDWQWPQIQYCTGI